MIMNTNRRIFLILCISRYLVTVVCSYSHISLGTGRNYNIIIMRHCAADLGCNGSQGLMSSTYVKQLNNAEGKERRKKDFSPLNYGILKREHPEPGLL